MTRDQLLGRLDPDTRQWQDGVLTSTAVVVNNEPQSELQNLLSGKSNHFNTTRLQMLLLGLFVMVMLTLNGSRRSTQSWTIISKIIGIFLNKDHFILKKKYLCIF